MSFQQAPQALPYTMQSRQHLGAAPLYTAAGAPLGPPMPLPPQASKKSFAQTAMTPKNVFVGAGVILLALLCVVPVWNAAALLQDANYIFWAGRSIPWWMIWLCVFIIGLYVTTVTAFFKFARPNVQTEQTIMMIANIFITLLGLALMLLSLPLSRQSLETYNNLMHRCDYSEQTHRMYEYSQVLHNIRAQPSCASEYSVEQCAGYENAPPYTNFLKAMENDFRCSGFCFRVAGAALAQAGGGANGTVSLVASSIRDSSRHHKDHVTQLSMDGLHQDKVTELGLVQVGSKQPAAAAAAVSRYPPTLFSDANYQASCEGMAARDIKNFAGDVGFQTFYQGIYLVLIAIATGFLKLIGFCVRKDRADEYQYGANYGANRAGARP